MSGLHYAWEVPVDYRGAVSLHSSQIMSGLLLDLNLSIIAEQGVGNVCSVRCAWFSPKKSCW